MRQLKLPLLSLALALWFPIGCASQSGAGDLVRVQRTWQSSGVTYGETDSLTTCTLRDGQVLVIATAKEADRLDVFDGATGKFIRSVGRTGDGPGQFRYPNGIVTAHVTSASTDRPVILVVERDNARVQALWADNFEPAGRFGDDVLHKPYGAALSYAGGRTHLFVTDETAPLNQRVHVFALRLADDCIDGRHVRSFGETTGPGVIHEPESIVIDDVRDRVFLCDEDSTAGKNVKIYTTDGAFTGTILGDGLIEGDPEGLAICRGTTDDLLLVTDQQKSLTTWHVFDLESLEHLGSFTGRPRIANTDGICVHAAPFGPFTGGALFAVDDDAEVCAYDLAAVRSAFIGNDQESE